MNFRFICTECEAPLAVFAKLDDDEMTITVEVCHACVARKVMLAEDEPWIRKKMLREGRAA